MDSEIILVDVTRQYPFLQERMPAVRMCFNDEGPGAIQVVVTVGSRTNASASETLMSRMTAAS